MFESRDTRTESQPPFGIDARRLPKATAGTFYGKLEATLESIGFTADVREICRPVYLAAEIPAFSMGRRAMSDEGAALAFANACLSRMIRIYNECWKQMA
jgi:hypothetical protein